MRRYVERQVSAEEPVIIRRSSAGGCAPDYRAAAANFGGPGRSPFAHDFSRIPSSVHGAATVQAKLDMNVPGDAREKEADALAEQVMQAAGEQTPTLTGRQTQSEHLQASPTPGVQDRLEGVEAMSPEVSERIVAARGGGSHMDGRTRSFMESRFGADFGGVKIHTDAEAVRLSRSIRAQAFAVGNDLFFDAGKYSPESHAGRRLLAHELAHTMQQRGALIQRQPEPQPQQQPSPQQQPQQPQTQPQQPQTPSPQPQPQPQPGSISLATLGELNEQIRIIGEVTLPTDIWMKNRTASLKQKRDILATRKVFAAEKLGELKEPRAVITLVAVLNDNVYGVKQLDPTQKAPIMEAAAEALGKIGGPDAVAELTKMLDSAELRQRKLAARAFRHLRGRDAGLELVLRLNGEADQDVKADMVFALGEIGPNLTAGPLTELMAGELIKVLGGIKTTSQNWMLGNTIKALGKFGDRRATKPLLDILLARRG
ncbi:MAG TPA: DUF4157 domain-containing protein, partial [Pyrinomonadaceae bacterium]|nr:DUF4157 domain-containing protein [Pyrinomonadaceae bacterium]